MKKKLKYILVWGAAAFLTVSAAASVNASTVSDLEKQQKEHQAKLDALTGQITEMEDEQAILEEEISDLDSEVINMFTSIELLEEEIGEKETSISVVEGDIAVAQYW